MKFFEMIPFNFEFTLFKFKKIFDFSKAKKFICQKNNDTKKLNCQFFKMIYHTYFLKWEAKNRQIK